MIEARYLDLGGSLAYVEAAGEGPSVLCLHTAGQSGVQWRHALGDLSALGYRVIVPDLPGHGRSEPTVGGPVRDLSRYAEWCIALIDELVLDRPYVMGCSIGGKICLDIATRIPERLAGLVAMAAEVAAPQPGGAAALDRGMEDASSPSRTDRTYYGTLAVCGRTVAPERVEMIATMHRREDPVITTSDLIGWFTHDLRDGIAMITCPTYLVVDDDDFWLDLDQVRWTGSQITGAHTLVLEGIGHYPMEEIPDFASVADGWLRTLAADSARAR